MKWKSTSRFVSSLLAFCFLSIACTRAESFGDSITHAESQSLLRRSFLGRGKALAKQTGPSQDRSLSSPRRRQRPPWLPGYAPNPRYDGTSRIIWLRLEGENDKGRMHFSLHEDHWSPRDHMGRLRVGQPLRPPQAIPHPLTLNPLRTHMSVWNLVTKLRVRNRYHCMFPAEMPSESAN